MSPQAPLPGVADLGDGPRGPRVLQATSGGLGDRLLLQLGLGGQAGPRQGPRLRELTHDELRTLPAETLTRLLPTGCSSPHPSPLQQHRRRNYVSSRERSPRNPVPSRGDKAFPMDHLASAADPQAGPARISAALVHTACCQCGGSTVTPTDMATGHRL